MRSSWVDLAWPCTPPSPSFSLFFFSLLSLLLVVYLSFLRSFHDLSRQGELGRLRTLVAVRYVCTSLLARLPLWSSRDSIVWPVKVAYRSRPDEKLELHVSTRICLLIRDSSRASEVLRVSRDATFAAEQVPWTSIYPVQLSSEEGSITTDQEPCSSNSRPGMNRIRALNKRWKAP